MAEDWGFGTGALDWDFDALVDWDLPDVGDWGLGALVDWDLDIDAQ